MGSIPTAVRCAVFPLSLAFVASLAQAQPLGVVLQEPIRVTVGGSLFSPTPLDFDLDGDIDLAVAEYSSKSIAIVENDGNGNFSYSAFVSLGEDNTGSPVHLVAADVDRDNDTDLVVLTQQPSGQVGPANSIRIIKNDGSGGFAFHSALQVGRSPLTVRVADVNIDGFHDYVVPNQGDNTVTIAYNQGDGTPGSLAVGGSIRVIPNSGGPVDVVVERIDSDIYPDLCVAAYGGNGVMIHRQTVGGVFLAPVTTEVYSPAGLAAIYPRVGIIDLVVTNKFLNTVTVLRNQEDGTFVPLAHDVGDFPGSVRTAYVDEDGITDIVVHNERDDTISLMRSRHKVVNGKYLFDQVVRPVGRINGFLMTADVTGDGQIDLITAESEGDLAIYPNASLTQEEIAFVVAGGTPSSPSGAVQADVARAISGTIDLIAHSVRLGARNGDGVLDAADLIP